MHTLFSVWITLVSAFSLGPSLALIQLRLQMFLPSKCHPQTWAAFWAVPAARAWPCPVPACSAHLSVTTLCSLSRESTADMPFHWATDERWFSSKLFHYYNFFFFSLEVFLSKLYSAWWCRPELIACVWSVFVSAVPCLSIEGLITTHQCFILPRVSLF